MWQRLTLFDLRIIGHYLGVLILLACVALLIPLGVALVFQEWASARHYLLAIGVFLIAGSILRFFRVKSCKLNRRQTLAVTGFAWIVLGLMSAFPLYLSGHYPTPLDAILDGVSGITTTGVCVISDLDHLSNADNMWRFMMHFLGGVGLIVVALSLGIFGKQTGGNLFASEGHSDHILPNVKQTSRFILKMLLQVIVAATLILFIVCSIIGMEPSRAFLHALWLSISGSMVAGFSPMAESIVYYHSFILEVVLMVLMLFGCISFTLHSQTWKGHIEAFINDLEIRTMLIWIAFMTFLFTAALCTSTSFSDLSVMLRRGLFTIIASLSTAGFQNITSNQMTTALPSGAFLVLIILMAVGGSKDSVAGGIKIGRIGLIGKSVVATLKERLAPESARVMVDYHHAGHRIILSADAVKEAMTVFVLYVSTYLIGGLVGIAYGYNAAEAMFESVSMTSNGGLSSGIISTGMPVPLEILYIFQMWAGRLEFVTLLALIIQIVVSLDPRRQSPHVGLVRVILVIFGIFVAAALVITLVSPRVTNAFAEPVNSETAVESVAAADDDASTALQGSSEEEEASGDLQDTAGLTSEGSEVEAGSENAINVQQLPDSSFIYETSLTDLAEADAYFNNQTVLVTGEAIGDVIKASISGSTCWATLKSTDDDSSLPIYMSADSAKKIDTLGRYAQTGTILQIQGTFHLVCEEHSGLTDIHADTVNVVALGVSTPDTFDLYSFIPSGISIALGLLVLAVYHFAARKQR